MDFKLPFHIGESPVKVKHKDKIILIGSCFSDEISFKLSLNGFQNFANPFGTLFHPLSIANSLNSSLSRTKEVNVIKSNDVFHAWDCAGVIHGYSENELREKVYEKRSETLKQIKDAKFLVVTFGTAWSYKHLELDIVVGNCHKEKQSSFRKQLNSMDEMLAVWIVLIERIKAINNDINIVFTVSPVRHKKDGLIENNRSKSRLIELVHKLTEFDGTAYFPSYEILIDELRDYRYYNEDMVHPSSQAVDYVWEQFERTYCDDSTKNLSRRVKQIKTSLAHKSLYPNSESNRKMLLKMEQSKEEILQEFPYLNF
ncbi:MAG: GSCFA domain-containing protein [Crocinitomicaceae bacterium]|nr:GSCFA domain-containing protein [Crocinitomicaceae bacterium]